MPSTYSPLKIQLMATGENNTTWGDVTNLNLGTAIEEAIVGSADVTFASGDVTLTLTDTNASQTARNMRLRCTGTTGGSTRNLVVPSIEKPYIVKNDCADSVTVKTAAGTGIAVPAGKTMWVYSDGTNVVDAVTHLSSLTLGTDLSVADGGTGASTFTANGVLYGNGASALQVTAAGTTGQVLVGNTGSAPSWATLTSTAVTSISFGTTGLTPSTATQGAVTVAGTLGVTNGGTGTSTQFTAGSVVFAGASGVYSQNNANLFWDNSNDRLGIGTATPSALLTVSNGGAAGYEVNPTGGVGGGATVATYNRNTSAYTSLTTYSSTMTWYANGSTRAMDLDSSGNLGIGTSAPTAYSGYTSLEIDNASNGGILSIKKAGSVVGYLNGASGLLLLAQSNDLKLTTTGSTSMQFSTNATERMRITSGGDVLVGKTATSVGTDGVQLLATGYSGFSAAGTTALFLNRNTNDGTILEFGRNGVSAATMGLTSSALTFGTAGSERMRIDSSGNLLVGTTSANASKLRVSAADGTYPLGVSGTTKGLRVVTNATDLRLDAVDNTLAASYEPLFLNGSIVKFGTSTTERMRIDSSGNVGIGTSSPATKLDVAGNLRLSAASPVIELNNGGPQVYTTAANTLQFATGGGIGTPTERMRITADGNLQLGTASLATNATNGFPYIPTCAGTPTGTPTAITGYAPMVVDSTNNKLYVYVGGAWQAMN